MLIDIGAKSATFASSIMAILLAPMEGLLDFPLRDVLTRAGGIDRCVSEFIRVTDTVLPARTFRRIVPELLTGSRTAAGTPVWVQLLGSDPICLADNAAQLATLAPAGIDLNFGCPAKVVNRHGGGAALLQHPDLLHRIVTEVRRAVPAEIPVSAKMRLGYRDDLTAETCAIAIAEGGASELVVHARTQAHGYKPPAYWNRIADVRQAINIPVIANGEVWTPADAARCLAESGCTHLMLGRGMVAHPGLARAIQAHQGEPPTPLTWQELPALLQHFWQLVQARIEPRARAGRLKQWLNYLRRTHPEAEQAYQTLRAVNDWHVLDAWVQNLSASNECPLAQTTESGSAPTSPSDLDAQNSAQAAETKTH